MKTGGTPPPAVTLAVKIVVQLWEEPDMKIHEKCFAQAATWFEGIFKTQRSDSKPLLQNEYTRSKSIQIIRSGCVRKQMTAPENWKWRILDMSKDGFKDQKFFGNQNFFGDAIWHSLRLFGSKDDDQG